MLNDVRILCFWNSGLVHGIWPYSCLCLVFVLCYSPLGIEGRHHDIFLILYELLNSKGNQGSACINSYIYPTNMINIKRVIDIVRRNCESIKKQMLLILKKYTTHQNKPNELAFSIQFWRWYLKCNDMFMWDQLYNWAYKDINTHYHQSHAVNHNRSLHQLETTISKRTILFAAGDI
jgi:hypothetical protein